MMESSHPTAPLETVSVFLDFDGTISQQDIGEVLLDTFCERDTWLPIVDAYRDGEYGSRECLQRLWSLLPSSLHVMDAVADGVPLDPAFSELVSKLISAGARVSVLSDGFGFYVERRCRPFELPISTNSVGSHHQLAFPHANEECSSCGECGTCKRAPIVAAKAEGQLTVFVGDGASDRHAATVADMTFAKNRLALWCQANGIQVTEIANLGELLGIIPTLAQRAEQLEHIETPRFKTES